MSITMRLDGRLVAVGHSDDIINLHFYHLFFVISFDFLIVLLHSPIPRLSSITCRWSVSVMVSRDPVS